MKTLRTLFQRPFRAPAKATQDDSGQAARSWRGDREAGLKTGLGMALLLSCFTISAAQAGGAFGGTWARAVGGPPASILLAATDTQIGVWFACAVALATGAAAVLAFLRREARMQEPKVERHVSGGPVDVRAVVEFVPRHDFNALRDRVDSQADDLHEVERRIEEKIEDNFRALTRERSVSIAGLHGKIDESERRNQQRFEQMIEKLGELRGEVHAARKGGPAR